MHAARIAAFAAAVSPASARFESPPNPFCEHHLAVVKPQSLKDEQGAAAELRQVSGALFEHKAAPLARPLTAPLSVRAGGVYALWLRVGQAAGPPLPVRCELLLDGAGVLTGTVHDGDGAQETGGPAGFAEYLNRARRNTLGGAAMNDLRLAADHSVPGEPALRSPTEQAEELLADFMQDIGRGTADAWVNLNRVEDPGPSRFHWWKAGTVELAAGQYQLRLQTDAGHGQDPGRIPLFDAALLTSFSDMVYPYAPDITAARASYVRFRIDATAPRVRFRVWINNHRSPQWRTPTVFLNPSGIDASAVGYHSGPGYTRWYCLQDIERAPDVSARGMQQLRINVMPETGGGTGSGGATQFAMFPYRDAVVRTFDWDEPDGLNINMMMDFEAGLHHLKTFRDCAREHYELAGQTADGRILPLTRPGLYLGTQASFTPYTQDYLCKTLRYLGFNVAGTPDPIAVRARYGWGSYTGNARMEWHVPSTNTAETIELYRKAYGHLRKEADLLTGCPIWQMTDEPGEGWRHAMSAPAWVYEEDPEPQWIDYPGQSELYTVRTDYRDCVLEGKIARHGGVLKIMAAVDKPRQPASYVWWRIGAVSPGDPTQTFQSGREDSGSKNVLALAHPHADLGNKLTPFKIVFESGRAALYLNDRLLHQVDGLPETGGFGFGEGAKALAALRIRPVTTAERLKPPDPFAVLAGAGGANGREEWLNDIVADLNDELERNPAGPPQAANLKTFVEKDWLVAGGHPEVHAKFRQWAALRGLQPALFGVKTWDQVTPLTVPELVRTPEDRRRFYWSRQFSAWLTPEMFHLAAQAIRHQSANPDLWAYVGLSGGHMNVFGHTISDMFQLASHGNGLMPGISDWYTPSADSQQVNAYSMAIFNAGARRPGREPASMAMMHIVHPSPMRAHVTLANQAKYLSYYTFGPYYLGSGGDAWSERTECYTACSLINNRAAQADDILRSARLRPARVAMLWSQSGDHWHQAAAFKDKRAAFLALAHDYFQPELVTEEQVVRGDLENYDALYVLEPHVAAPAQERIAAWVRQGGLLWSSADALTRNEYDEPLDLLQDLCGLERQWTAAPDTEDDIPADAPRIDPVPNGPVFLSHTVATRGMPDRLHGPDATVRGRYADERPAWLEWNIGRGTVVYIAHRAGLTYTAKRSRLPGHGTVWADTGRVPLTTPLLEAGVERELILSEPLIMANALDSEQGTVIVLYNMHPAPRSDVEIVLAESAPPYSVETFNGFDPVALPYRFENKRVHMTLPELDGGQMIVVRRNEPPADDRLAHKRRRVDSLLASTHALDIAAAVWFAGHFPEWDMAGQLMPFVNHEQWEVRRAAAEALGQLRHQAAGAAIAEAFERETDCHAKGDQLVAMARLGHAAAWRYCAAAMANGENVFLMQQAVRAAHVVLETGAVAAADAMTFTLAAVAQPDLRVRREGIRLLASLDPAALVDGCLNAFAGAAHDPAQPDWAAALAGCNEAFGMYLQRGAPGGATLLLAVAGLRGHPELAPDMASGLEGINTDNVAEWTRALLRQANPALTRAVFEKRDTVPAIDGALPGVLNAVFDVRLGADMEDWQKWVSRQHDHAHE